MNIKYLPAYCQLLLLPFFSAIAHPVVADITSHWLAPYKVDCNDQKKCLNMLAISQPASSNQWQPLKSSINGFHFESGQFYKLKLKGYSGANKQQPKLVQVIEKTSQHFLPATRLVADNQWQLTLLKTLPTGLLATLDKKPYISLSNEGIFGFSGCNRIFGKQEYIFEAKNYQQSMIKFGPMAMTRMACHKNSVNQIEHQVSLLFTQVNKFSVDWPVLSFYHDNKLLAQFTHQR